MSNAYNFFIRLYRIVLIYLQNTSDQKCSNAKIYTVNIQIFVKKQNYNKNSTIQIKLQAIYSRVLIMNITLLSIAVF